ncbi:MAG: SHOCT domain-containing protein [Planctomycetes bacterium]|nr:SHOCT domain-containing protein [Planctomycetota bacterium]
MRLVDEELQQRIRDGVDTDPEKEIDLFLTRALDSVDDVSMRVGGKVAEFGLKAAQEAASGGGQAAWALAKGAAQGAITLGGRLGRKRGGAESPEVEPLDLPPALEGPGSEREAASGIPALIRELARLHADGILTDEEFRAKKAELLKRL